MNFNFLDASRRKILKLNHPAGELCAKSCQLFQINFFAFQVWKAVDLNLLESHKQLLSFPDNLAKIPLHCRTFPKHVRQRTNIPTITTTNAATIKLESDQNTKKSDLKIAEFALNSRTTPNTVTVPCTAASITLTHPTITNTVTENITEAPSTTAPSWSFFKLFASNYAKSFFCTNFLPLIILINFLIAEIDRL